MWAGVVVLDFSSLNKAEERWSQKEGQLSLYTWPFKLQGNPCIN